MISDQKTVRIVGWLYFLVLILGAYSLMFVSSQVEIVKGDAVATAQNLLANEFLFRTGIFCGFVSNIIFVILVLYLYKLFKPVNEYRAKIMVGLVVVQVPISLLLSVCEITSLMIVKGGVLETFKPGQGQDMAMLLLKFSDYGVFALMMFWGLWLIPLGQLIYQLGTIPRIIAALLIVASIGYVIESAIFFLWPSILPSVKKITFMLIFGELPVIFWLFVKGVMNRPLVAEKVTSET